MLRLLFSRMWQRWGHGEPARLFPQPVRPLLQLVTTNMMGLGQLNQCLLSPDGFNCHLRLESRAVIQAWSPAHYRLHARSNHVAFLA